MFDTWIADHLTRIEATVGDALETFGVGSAEVAQVFMTGGSSLSVTMTLIMRLIHHG